MLTELCRAHTDHFEYKKIYKRKYPYQSGNWLFDRLYLNQPDQQIIDLGGYQDTTEDEIVQQEASNEVRFDDDPEIFHLPGSDKAKDPAGDTNEDQDDYRIRPIKPKPITYKGYDGHDWTRDSTGRHRL